MPLARMGGGVFDFLLSRRPFASDFCAERFFHLNHPKPFLVQNASFWCRRSF
jgi:hypothetical protein